MTEAEAAQDPDAGSGSRQRDFGDYRILEEIARGGMGVVYKARQISLNRTVALKMILAGRLSSPGDVRRFYAEAEAAASLDHPGIVAVHEVGEFEGQHFFSMAYVAGRSLGDEIAHGAIAPRRAAGLMLAIARATAYAHTRGVIHRDLKPENVLLDEAGQPRITDFGLARRTDDDSHLTATGQILGTPSFMPPEQARGRIDDLGTTADVYSLGAILYAVQTGRPPFQGENAVEILQQVLHREPVAPRQLVPSLPLDLETICLKCLCKEPARRYASAGELADDLERWLEHKPIHARPIGRIGRLRRWCRRNPTAASLAGTAVASGFLVIFAVFAGLWAALAERRTAHGNLYAANTQLAHRAWQTGDVTEMLDLLERNRPASELPSSDLPELRGWEWYYLKGLDRSAHRILQGPPNRGVFSASWSPDGMHLATSTWNQAIAVWDGELGDEVFSVSSESDGFRAKTDRLRGRTVRWSPDGRLVAWADGYRENVANSGGDILLVDPSNGAEVRRLRHGGFVDSLAWSPDGRRLASVGGGTGKLWSGTSFDKVIEFTATGGAIAFGSGGEQIATSGPEPDSDVVIRSTVTGHVVRVLAGHRSRILALAWQPGGTDLAVASQDGRVRVWDTVAAQVRDVHWPSADAILAVAWSPSGDRLAAAGRAGMITVFSPRQPGVLRLVGHESFVWDLDWNKDGRRLVSASDDETARVWDTTRDQDALRFRGAASAGALAWSPGGSELVSGGRGGILEVRDGRDDRVVRSASDSGFLAALAWSPDGESVAASWTGKVKLLDAESFAEKRVLAGGHDPVHDLVWSPDSSRVALTRGESVDILNPTSGGVIRSLGPFKWPAKALAWHPSREVLASAHDDGIRLWHPTTGAQRSVFGESFHTLKRDGSRIAYPGSWLALAWSPDGDSLASASRMSGMVKIWSASGEEIRAIRAHSGSNRFGLFGGGVNVVLWSVDGRRLFTAGADTTIRVLDVATGTELLTLRGHESPILALALTADGRRLASSDQQGVLRVWDSNRPRRGR